MHCRESRKGRKRAGRGLGAYATVQSSLGSLLVKQPHRPLVLTVWQLPMASSAVLRWHTLRLQQSVDTSQPNERRAMHCMMEEGAAGAGRWLDTNPCSTTLRVCHGTPAVTAQPHSRTAHPPAGRCPGTLRQAAGTCCRRSSCWRRCSRTDLGRCTAHRRTGDNKGWARGCRTAENKCSVTPSPPQATAQLHHKLHHRAWVVQTQLDSSITPAVHLPAPRRGFTLTFLQVPCALDARLFSQRVEAPGQQLSCEMHAELAVAHLQRRRGRGTPSWQCCAHSPL